MSADASKNGLGAVILQKESNNTSWQPVAYASRAMSPTEIRYAQIEKEALAVTWACEKFEDFLVGMQFHIETDHKPLVPLLGVKNLDELPLRVQRFRLRLMRFCYSISHVPGKDLNTADTLSRAPIRGQNNPETERFQDEVLAYVNAIMLSLPATERKLQQIKEATEQDEICQQIIYFCLEGWPEDKSTISGAVTPYYPFRGEISLQNGLLLKGDRLIIPSCLRLDVLDKLHEGHQGIVKCRERAKASVWWPGLSKQLGDLVQQCTTCAKERYVPPETLMPSALPQRPWQKVGTDLFEWHKNTYVLIVDYFSRYIEVAKMQATTSRATVEHCKSIFARHGVPEIVMSDNGPQYSSGDFASFAEEYGFTHITSSPKFPQSNGEAERAVKTIKGLLQKSGDPYRALMAYRATPISNGSSPAELLMGRKIRTTLPVHPSTLKPRWPDMEVIRQKEELNRSKQEESFNIRHGARDLPILHPNTSVVLRGDNKTPATIVQRTKDPRSYEVETQSGGVLRRNRRDLVNIIPQSASEETTTEATTAPQTRDVPSDSTTRSGRTSKPPDRYGWD